MADQTSSAVCKLGRGLGSANLQIIVHTVPIAVNIFPSVGGVVFGEAGLIFQSQIAGVYNLQIDHLCVTRLPQGIVVKELGLIGGFLPCLHIGAVHELDIQISPPGSY